MTRVVAAIGAFAPKQILAALKGADVVVELRPAAEDPERIAFIVALLSGGVGPNPGTAQTGSAGLEEHCMVERKNQAWSLLASTLLRNSPCS
jgi:hypothetical protein